MKSLLIRFLLVATCLSVSCQLFSSPPDRETLTEPEEPTPEQVIPILVPTDEPTSESTSAEIIVTDVISPLPSPTLFNVAWDDKEVFRSGLVTVEQEALEKLSNATIYNIRLQFDEPLNLIEGQQELLYTNQEDTNLEEIYFHLFPNILGGEIVVLNLKVNSEPVTPIYETGNSLMRLPLDEPLEPSSQVVISMDFVTVVPIELDRNYGIFAHFEDVLALAHFYPLISVYDDDGWNIEPPVAQGDVIYSDASFYLVSVTAPTDQVIVASGVELEREETDDRNIVTFSAGPARDFYLASSDQYVVRSRKAGETQINSYAPAEFGEAAETVLDYADFALGSFDKRFGPYPYTELDIVSTPTLALGIEYPGLFANALRIYDTAGESSTGIPNQILLESTTVHETGHQWFYNVVGNDQLDEPWLDEALTQYATWQYYVDRYGPENAQGYYQSLVGRWDRVEQADIPIGLPVRAYQDAEYGAIIYGRGPIFVNELAQVMGRDIFDNFLRDYFREFRWANVSTDEFKGMAEQYCQCDLTAIFTAWVFAQ